MNHYFFVLCCDHCLVLWLWMVLCFPCPFSYLKQNDFPEKWDSYGFNYEQMLVKMNYWKVYSGVDYLRCKPFMYMYRFCWIRLCEKFWNWTILTDSAILLLRLLSYTQTNCVHVCVAFLTIHMHWVYVYFWVTSEIVYTQSTHIGYKLFIVNWLE